MGYREQAAAREWQAYRRRRLRLFSFTVGFYLFAILIALAVLAWRTGTFKRIGQQPRPPDEVALTFDFNRAPITRQFVVNIIPSDASPGVRPGDDLLVRTTSDLRRRSKAGEFPSGQITVGVTRFGQQNANLTVTANPWEPEKVKEGLYFGRLEIQGGAVSQTIPISIWLRSREDGSSWIALALLIGGAALGLVVKWITERLTPQAALVRRLASIKDAIGYDEESPNLPVAVRLRIQRLEDLIAREDYAEAQAGFDALEQSEEQLAFISSKLTMLVDQVRSQLDYVERARKGLKPADRLLLEGVIDTEYRDVQDLMSEPAADLKFGDEYHHRLATCRMNFGTAGNMIAAYVDRPDGVLRSCLEVLQNGDYQHATDLYFEWRNERPADAEVALNSEEADVVVDPSGRARRGSYLPRRRARISFAFRYARLLAGGASIVVVGLVGLKLQYLDDQTFNGGLSAWLALALWGATVELSGLSVLDVLGRLGGSGQAVSKGGR